MSSAKDPAELDDDQLADALEGKAHSISAGAIGDATIPAGTTAGLTINGTAGRSEALTAQELDSLTFMSGMLSVQVRSLGDFTDGSSSTMLAVYHPKSAPRFRENGRPYEVRELDVIRLRDLLNEATRRGLLS